MTDKLTWQTKKPKLTKEGVMLIATKHDTEWYYQAYKIAKIYFGEKWYFGLIDGYGNEEPYDFKADRYLIIEGAK